VKAGVVVLEVLRLLDIAVRLNRMDMMDGSGGGGRVRSLRFHRKLLLLLL
jgi:hypothetical protein